MKIVNKGPRKAWDREECEKVVGLYNKFLGFQQKDEPYQKAASVREVAADIGRSKGSVEAKLMNVSGVRVELGLEIVKGYKPLSGYQKLLAEVVVDKNGGV